MGLSGINRNVIRNPKSLNLLISDIFRILSQTVSNLMSFREKIVNYYKFCV